jgi:hypothetical protein
MTIRTSSLGASGSLPRLAPDLTLPATSNSPNNMLTNITGINPSAGLTTVISITGTKGYIPFLSLFNLLSENYTIKLTIDGVVIWNDVKNVGSATTQFIGNGATLDVAPFNDSFLFEVQSTTDTSISCSFLMRKIL